MVALVVLGGGLFLPFGLWTRAQPIMRMRIRDENITTSMRPTYIKSVTGGFKLGWGSSGALEYQPLEDVFNFITRFTLDDLGGVP